MMYHTFEHRKKRRRRRLEGSARDVLVTDTPLRRSCHCYCLAHHILKHCRPRVTYQCNYLLSFCYNANARKGLIVKVRPFHTTHFCRIVVKGQCSWINKVLLVLLDIITRVTDL